MVELVGGYSKATSHLKRLQRAQKILENPGKRRVAQPAPRVHKVKRRLTPIQLQHIVTEYQAGLPTTHLMKQYGLGKSTVLNVLHDAGVPLRNQGLAPDELPRAIALYESGLSLKSVAAQFTCDAETVRTALKAAGVTMRKPWEH